MNTPSDENRLNWDMVAFWSLVVVSLAALVFVICIIWAECGASP